MTLRPKVKCFLQLLLLVWVSETLVFIFAMVGHFTDIAHTATTIRTFILIIFIFTGMSYPISGQNPGYKHAGYDVAAPLIPHGVSVAVSAPAVFRFTGASNPQRHLEAAEAFGVDTSNVKLESAGEVLAEALTKFLADLGDQPAGLKDLGFGNEHIDALVEGTIPQARVLMLAPGLDKELQTEREQLRRLFEDAMSH
jgi:alcohol dehydrogenase class IV